MTAQEHQQEPKWTFRLVVHEIVDILKSPMAWFVISGIALLVTTFYPVFFPSPAKAALQAKAEALYSTPSGKFAVDHLHECMRSGPLLSRGPTQATCINSTVLTARTLRGEAFADEVRAVLAEQFAPTQVQQTN